MRVNFKLLSVLFGYPSNKYDYFAMEKIVSVKKDKFFIQNEILIKEYDMWRDDIWKDAPRISPPKDEWADLPKVSPILSTRSNWSPPKTRSNWNPPPTTKGTKQLPKPIGTQSIQFISEKPSTNPLPIKNIAGPSRPQNFDQVDSPKSPPVELEPLTWTDSESGWVTASTDSPLSPDEAPGSNWAKRGMSSPMKSPPNRVKTPPNVLALAGPSTSSTYESSPIITPETQQPEWKTPEKTEPPKVDLDSSPRTSTPVSDRSGDFSDSESKKDQYECFKIHLNASPKKMKVRGGIKYENETIIAGHINMKNMDPFSYTFEEYYLPNVNRCFLNLLLHGPTPLMCHEHYDPHNPNNYVANCHCIPVCNCRANIVSNKNLPIGYKYNEEGIVVPSMPAMPPRSHQRNPGCIYTEFV